MQIKTVADLETALAAGPYTRTGSYPLFFVMADGGALSFDAAKDEVALLREALTDRWAGRDWRPVAVDVNWEDAELYCAHTGARIESAYAEPDAAGSRGAAE